MQTTGELLDDKIIITKSKDVARLNERGKFGKKINNNILEISFLEGLFLAEEEKLKVFQNKKNVSFEEIMLKSAEKVDNLEIKYLVFKDLRNRGKIVIINDSKNIDFCCMENKKIIGLIKVFSERNHVDFEDVLSYIKKAEKMKTELIFAVVDEEGDITYYTSKSVDLKGSIEPMDSFKAQGCLFQNRVMIFDEKTSEFLFEKEFFGKPFAKKHLQLSFIEALYLLEKEVLEIKDISKKENIKINDLKDIVKNDQPDLDILLKVFSDLKKRGLIVKTGFKFGVHFRAYADKPGKTHAEYMIHVLKNGVNVMWSEISRAVRLSHTVNKDLVFGFCEKNLQYIEIGRIRP